MSCRGYYGATITVRLESPFLSAGIAGAGFGFDVAHLRGPRQPDGAPGAPIFPGTLIRGVLRHSLAQMEIAGATVSPALQLFGAPGEAAENTGHISFDDFEAEGLEGQTQRLSRIEIDESTGAVVEGHLLTVELVAPVGQVVPFSGAARWLSESADEASIVASLLASAFRHVVAIGAFKTAGFGRIDSVDVGSPVLLASAAAEPFDGREPAPGAVYELSFRLDRPLLVDAVRAEENAIASADVVSGAAIKGALARRIIDARSGAAIDRAPIVDGRLGEALSRLVVHHAEPWLDGRRVRRWLPLSLVEHRRHDGVVELSDAAAPTNVLEAGDDVGEIAFAPDWKDDRLEPLPTSFRTRLAIDADTGAGLRGAVFSEQVIEPVADLVWRGRIAVPRDADPSMMTLFAELLGFLATRGSDRGGGEGVFHLGKTSARMVEPVLELVSPPDDLDGSGSGRFVVVLATPHLMCRVDALEDERSLEDAMRCYWKSVSDPEGLLRIAEDEAGRPLIFARQVLRGGFQAARFAMFGDDVLEPFVLMDRGSVFVLEADRPDEAAMALRRFEAECLPLPAELRADARHDTCPFLPENGFGAIEVCRGQGVDFDRWRLN